MAAVHSNNAKVSELLAAGADANNYYGISPLAAAAQRGNLETVELLLRAGAQATNSRYGNKPLLSATLQISYTHPTPSLEILQRLLRYGANVDERAMNTTKELRILCLHQLTSCSQRYPLRCSEAPHRTFRIP